MFVKIADLVIEIKSRHKYTFDMCKDYLYDGDTKPVFTIFASNEQIIKEREASPEYSEPILEFTCIYRELCDRLLEYDALLIHSAAISVHNNGYLFSANSGTGKTTHMNLWLDKFGDDAFIINGDKPIIRKVNDEFYVFGTPWCGKEGYNINKKVKLKSIAIIKRAENNSIKKVSNKDALLFLLTQTYHPKTKEGRELMYNSLGELIKSIPVYEMLCNMEKEACEVCYREMSK